MKPGDNEIQKYVHCIKYLITKNGDNSDIYQKQNGYTNRNFSCFEKIKMVKMNEVYI